jgi:hypothetical protein
MTCVDREHTSACEPLSLPLHVEKDVSSKLMMKVRVNQSTTACSASKVKAQQMINPAIENCGRPHPYSAAVVRSHPRRGRPDQQLRHKGCSSEAPA